MLTKQDKKFLKETFATKEDLENFVKKPDLEPIKKSLGAMNRKLDLTIRYFDKGTASHEPRIKVIEDQLGITSTKN